MLNEYDKQNIQKILEGHGDWFTANLLRLIAGADVGNRAKLFLSFPKEVNCVHEYQTGSPFIRGVEKDQRETELNPEGKEKQ